jgi:hypothetical protein
MAKVATTTGVGSVFGCGLAAIRWINSGKRTRYRPGMACTAGLNASAPPIRQSSTTMIVRKAQSKRRRGLGCWLNMAQF